MTAYKTPECRQPMICDERFKYIREELDEVKDRVTQCEQTKEILIELKVLSKEQAKANEQRDVLLKDQSELLTKTVQSLEYVVKNQDEHADRISEMDTKISNVEDKGKIDTSTFVRDSIILILGAAGAYFLQQVFPMLFN